jgi:hypothetical protein
MDPADIEKRFTYHPPKGDDPATYQFIRAQAKAFAHLLDEKLPEGREKSLAMTHLEETVFWANAGIARAD